MFDAEEYSVGAFTVANLNNTDGDSLPNGDSLSDNIDDDVTAFTDQLGKIRGVDEVDLMRLQIDQPVGYVTGTAVEIIVRHGADFVHFWTDKTKQTELPLDQNGKIDIGFGSGEMTKDIWVEAQNWSNVRGIEIEARYNGNSDWVRATAVWAQAVDYEVNNALSPAQILAAAPWNELSATGNIRTYVNDIGGVGLRPPGPLGVKNVIVQAWEILPLGIQNEPRLKFDITRRMEWISIVQEANDQWKFLPAPGTTSNFVRFPDLLDQANDDKSNLDGNC